MILGSLLDNDFLRWHGGVLGLHAVGRFPIQSTNEHFPIVT